MGAAGGAAGVRGRGGGRRCGRVGAVRGVVAPGPGHGRGGARGAGAARRCDLPGRHQAAGHLGHAAAAPVVQDGARAPREEQEHEDPSGRGAGGRGRPAGGGRGTRLRRPSCEGASDDRPLGTADRVLVFTVPTLSWADLDRVDAPHLEGLLGSSAVADLSVRSVSRRTTAADGYATLNAGHPGRGHPAGIARVRRRTDTGDRRRPDRRARPRCSSPSPPTRTSTRARSRRRHPTPSTPPRWHPRRVRTTTARPRRRSSPGAPVSCPRWVRSSTSGSCRCGTSTPSCCSTPRSARSVTPSTDHGVGRAVIANGDHGEGDDDVELPARGQRRAHGRQRPGRARSGRSHRCSRSTPRAPFGTRYDNGEVASAFGEFWEPTSVVLVEASDMVRYEDAMPLMLPVQQDRQRDAAIQRSDELLGQLLEQVDLARDAVVVVAPVRERRGHGPDRGRRARSGGRGGAVVVGHDPPRRVRADRRHRARASCPWSERSSPHRWRAR